MDHRNYYFNSDAKTIMCFVIQFEKTSSYRYGPIFFCLVVKQFFASKWDVPLVRFFAQALSKSLPQELSLLNSVWLLKSMRAPPKFVKNLDRRELAFWDSPFVTKRGESNWNISFLRIFWKVSNFISFWFRHVSRKRRSARAMSASQKFLQDLFRCAAWQLPLRIQIVIWFQ